MAIEAAAAAAGGPINQSYNPTVFLYYNTPLPTTTTTATTFDMSEPPPPLYQPTPTDSGLTFNHNNTTTGKRSTDYYNYSIPSPLSQRPRLPSLFETEAAPLHFHHHHHHTDFDSLIAHHTQRLTVELEERAKQRSKYLVLAVQEAVAARLREKDEEIERLVKLNLDLQERIRSLCVENNLWRGLAQTSEAAANSLRTDLERVLTSPGLVEDRKPDDDNDDAESCCGSSDGGMAAPGCKGGCGGEREAGVLVMPCRHLCLCTTCGSRRESCPVCGSAITASVHVNFSPS